MIKAHRMFEDGGLSREPSACHVTCKIFLLYENSKPNHCTDQVIFRDQLPPAAACTRARSGSGARTPRYPIHTHGRSSPPASVRGSSPTAAEVPTDGDDPALAGAARGREARDPTGDESDAAPSSIHPIPPARTQQQALRIAHRLSGRVGPSPSGRLRRAPHRTAWQAGSQAEPRPGPPT